VGRIYLGERFVNMEIVRDGFAWRYVVYDKPREFAAAYGLIRIRCRRGSGERPSASR
jgi:hypothetical protein